MTTSALKLASPPPTPTYSVPGDAEYLRNERWNRELDRDNNGPIKIEGKSFQPSWVLFCMDRPTYLARIEDLKRRRKEKITKAVLRDYPTPIAHNFDRFVNGFKDQRDRLDHLRNTWEATISLLLALVVGEVRQRALSLQGLALKRDNGQQPFFFKHLLTDSLATRLDLTKAILEHATNNAAPLKVAEHVPITAIERIRELNRVRNNLAHRSPISETQSRQLIEASQEEVFEILAELRGLRRVVLVRYLQNVGPVMKHERFQGAGLRRDIKEVCLTAEQRAACDRYCTEGRVLGLIGDAAPVSLQPFICCQERASGHLTRVCFFKTRSSGGVDQFEDLSESEFVPIESTTYNDDMNDLRSLFGLTPDPT